MDELRRALRVGAGERRRRRVAQRTHRRRRSFVGGAEEQEEHAAASEGEAVDDELHRRRRRRDRRRRALLGAELGVGRRAHPPRVPRTAGRVARVVDRRWSVRCGWAQRAAPGGNASATSSPSRAARAAGRRTRSMPPRRPARAAARSRPTASAGYDHGGAAYHRGSGSGAKVNDRRAAAIATRHGRRRGAALRARRVDRGRGAPPWRTAAPRRESPRAPARGGGRRRDAAGGRWSDASAPAA